MQLAASGEKHPLRKTPIPEGPKARDFQMPTLKSPMLWAVSFGVWTLVSVLASFSIYEYDLAMGRAFYFARVMGLEFSQILTYAPLTPIVFVLAAKFSFTKENWMKRALLHLGIA